MRFSDFASEFYIFAADNCAPFYSLPIECTDRDPIEWDNVVLYDQYILDRKLVRRRRRS